jgi:hypothetical protein
MESKRNHILTLFHYIQRKAWEGGEENYPEATAATFNGFGLFFAWCVGPCPVNTDIGGREVESYS